MSRSIATWLTALAVALTACGGIADLQREGQRCTRTEECAPGLLCAHDGTCQPEGAPGTAIVGDPCTTTVACRFGLVCSSEGICAEPGGPGTTGFGEACDDTSDCQRGLTCDDGRCLGLQTPLWPGIQCPDPEEDASPFRVKWSLQGDLDTFYDHPFPDDTRVAADGTVDMAGHPSPGELIALVGDVPRRIADEVGRGLGGAGPNQAVFLRMSAYPDPSSLSFGIPGLDEGSLAVVDLDDDTAVPTVHPFGYEISSGRTPYLCHNWVSVFPTDGRPYTPGHRYAVLIGAGVRSDTDGSTLSRSEDLSAMLRGERPSQGPLADGWDAYAPLRAWMDRHGVEASDLGGAVVFTVQDVEARPAAVHAAVQQASLPRLTDAIRCGQGADPFLDPDDPLRGCSPEDARFAEVQGLLTLPRWQAGTPPFKLMEDGGAIAIEGGLAQQAGADPVHVALTIPQGEPPEAGWPLVIYGHGTGGAYTSAVRTGVAAALADAAFDGDTVPFATLGFDAPMHGPRAFPANHDPDWLEVSPSAYDPDLLFFNPLNPLAARDNVLQQAADLWMLARWAAQGGVASDDSPTGEAILFDPANLYYLGHSQGGVVAPIFAAWDTDVAAVAMSGAGGFTLRSLLGKTSPNDLPSLLQVALADPTVDRVHPMLNLAQALADGADGVNFGRRVTRAPLPDRDGQHVLMISGQGDTYTPDGSQYALARAMLLDQILEGADPFDILQPVTPPVSANLSGTRTGVVARYTGGERDAHFVLFDRPAAMQRVTTYFASAVLEGTPTVE